MSPFISTFLHKCFLFILNLYSLFYLSDLYFVHIYKLLVYSCVYKDLTVETMSKCAVYDCAIYTSCHTTVLYILPVTRREFLSVSDDFPQPLTDWQSVHISMSALYNIYNRQLYNCHSRFTGCIYKTWHRPSWAVMVGLAPKCVRLSPNGTNPWRFGSPS